MTSIVAVGGGSEVEERERRGRGRHKRGGQRSLRLRFESELTVL